MKRNELVAHICQNFADMVAGCETYEDYASLMDALDIAINKLPEVVENEDVEKEDIQGWLNPHLDMIADDWEEWK